MVEQHVDSGDALAHPLPPATDTGLTVLPSPGACGTARACVPGWDLRVVRVALPGPVVPTESDVVVTVEVENRGRTDAPAAELALCHPDPARARCATTLPLSVVVLPPLAAGARAVIHRAVRTPGDNHSADPTFTLAAEVDREHTLSERDVTNNYARTSVSRLEPPALEIVRADLPPTVHVGTALPVALAVRNPSAVAPSPATEVGLSGTLLQCAANTAWGGAPNRVSVPTLPPRATITYTLLVPDASRCLARETSLGVWIDPANRTHWRYTLERSVRRAYAVVP